METRDELSITLNLGPTQKRAGQFETMGYIHMPGCSWPISIEVPLITTRTSYKPLLSSRIKLTEHVLIEEIQ